MEDDGDFVKYVCEVKFDKITVANIQFDFIADELSKPVSIALRDGATFTPVIYYKIKQFSNDACSRDASWIGDGKWIETFEPIELGYFGKYQILFNFEKQSTYVNENSYNKLSDTSKSIKDNTDCCNMTVLTIEETVDSIYFTNIEDFARFEISLELIDPLPL